MKEFIDWIKRNPLSVFLLIVVLFLSYVLFLRNAVNQTSSVGLAMPQLKEVAPSYYDSAPNLGVRDRLLTQESYLSLLVKNVTQARKEIIEKTVALGGYMVNSNVENPQDAPTATVTVRVPSKRLNEALDYFRGISVKVISENLIGEDVTDQYIDIQARKETLLSTKARLEDLLERATQVEDILNIQRELINIQSQLDSLQGQEDYLKKNAEAAKITVYLSTDELSLPYAPSEAWRPGVIFKQAVRSVVSTFRKLGTLIIWLAVYSVIWVPAVALIYIIKKRRNR